MFTVVSSPRGGPDQARLMARNFEYRAPLGIVQQSPTRHGSLPSGAVGEPRAEPGSGHRSDRWHDDQISNAGCSRFVRENVVWRTNLEVTTDRKSTRLNSSH